MQTLNDLKYLIVNNFNTQIEELEMKEKEFEEKAFNAYKVQKAKNQQQNESQTIMMGADEITLDKILFNPAASYQK